MAKQKGIRILDKPQNKFRHRQKKENSMAKKCQFCGSEMKPRGTSDGVGGTSWKCKNKKCGRTLWTWRKATPPIPLTTVSLLQLKDMQ